MYLISIKGFLLFFVVETTIAFRFVPEHREVVYEYVGNVNVEAQAPWDELDKAPPEPSGWKVRGTFKLQRIDADTLAAALVVEKISINKVNGTSINFYQNKEMQALYNPFKITYENDTISDISFRTEDAIWSKNFKRALASALQVQGSNGDGAFIVKENGIHGNCSTEYYVETKSNGHLSVRKTPELNTCIPFKNGIHSHRRNVPEMKCESNLEKNVIVGNEATYDLRPIIENSNSIATNSTIIYHLNEASIKGTTLLQTYESTGESQFIASQLQLVFISDNEIVTNIDLDGIDEDAATTLKTEEHHIDDFTGGRQPADWQEMLHKTMELLSELADSVEHDDIKFDAPYEGRVAVVIRLIGRLDLPTLEKLFTEISAGSSYHQETVRNLFFDIIPRIGTEASVLLTRDIIVKCFCKSTTSIQLLITMPFHIADTNAKLVEKVESLMSIGPERPDVRLVGILSFSTIVHNAFASGKMDVNIFQKYVKKYFDLFVDAYGYEQKMLYLQGLRNLRLDNVVDYLNPLIRDTTQSDDIRFLAMFITMENAWSRSNRDKIYETFWPILENRTAALELRVAAFNTLLVSYPTPARLMSIHALMESETDPHLINFYRTTILSLAGTTQPCYRKLRRLTSYMIRHLPKAPPKRYTVTGNYIYDYQAHEFGMGGSFQALFIGNSKTHLPQIGFFKLEQEALGKYTDQYALYIKARGFDNVISRKMFKLPEGGTITLSKIREMLNFLKMPTIGNTPVHLEIILQIEGKSVLLLYVNQNTFTELTSGDVMKRIMAFLQSDSHINLQNLRWPFYTRYSIPTVLGTPSSMTIQSTVLSSLRGNITKTNESNCIQRTHQIDLRHSIFTVVTSKSYNPFLNIEHSVNREQGFLTYFAINNEILLNFAESLLRLSFYRPKNIANGISLRSRTVTQTMGRIQRSSELYNEFIICEGDPKLTANKLIDVEIKDLGLTITGETHPFDVVSHVRLLANMNPTINVLVEPNGIDLRSILNLWILIRLNNNHIGTNKKFKLLFHSVPNSKIEGTFKVSFDDKSAKMNEAEVSENKSYRLDVTFEHKSNDKVLNHLDTAIKLNNFHNSEQFQLTTYIRHVDTDKIEWRLCTDATYQPIIFLTKPYSLNGITYFGYTNSTEKSCPKDKSKIIFNIYGDVLTESKSAYAQTNAHSGESNCPREVLKFEPPAQNKLCDRNIFSYMTTINEFGLNVTFEKSPQWLEDNLNRVDHFVTAFSPDIKLFDFKSNIDANVNTLSDKLGLNANINGKNFSLPNFPLWLNTNFDAKFDTLRQQFSFDYGLMHMCSIIAGKVKTFEDITLNLTDYTRENCSVLLAADCSTKPNFALFAKSLPAQSDVESFELELFIDDDTVIYTPRADQSDWISLNGQTESEIVTEVVPLDGRLKITRNAEGLLIFQIYESIQIQYFRGNVLTTNVAATVKGKLCGICSLPFNKVIDYNRCN